MRRAANIDGNHREIVAALEARAAEVTSLAAVGGGVPDLLVSFRGQWFLLEVKNGRKPPSARKLTAGQIRWHARQQAKIHVVTTVDDALRAVGVMPSDASDWALQHIS